MGDSSYLNKSGKWITYHKKNAGRMWKTFAGSLIALDKKDHSHFEMDNTLQGRTPLTSAQVAAIKGYSGNDYIEINQAMYSFDKNGLNAYENGSYQGRFRDNITRISEATNDIIKKPLNLYRGENLIAIENMLGTKDITDSKLNTLVGKVMALKGFASTAYRASDSFSSKPVFIEINAPNGVRGRVITDISEFGHSESELLLNNSGGLLIKKIKRNGKQIIIKADYIF